MVIHAIRYDDFSACSSVAVEEKLAALCLKHRIPCTFGVIPFVCSPESLLSAGEVKLSPLLPDRAELLKPLLEAGLAEIALHGYAHLAVAPVRGHQEFSQRMSEGIQRQLIQRGRSHLEKIFGVRVRLYVPPWNKLAPTTAGVLHEAGLLVSTGGPEVAGAVLGQLPCAVEIAGTSRALATAQRFGNGGNCVGTVMHDYDFKDSNLGVSELPLAQFEETLLRWKNTGPVEQRLISNAISDDPEAECRKARANAALAKVVRASRLRRKFFSRMLDVYWDTKTAEKSAKLLKFIP